MSVHNADPDEASTNRFDPLVPRPIDRPTTLPLDGRLDPEAGDIAKIFAAPDDPADWPAWRAALTRWRTEAHERLAYRGTRYDRPETAWTASCYSVALVWLWDERLFDRAAGRFDVAGFLAKTEDHGGFDGVVLWHAYPIIGIDDRNQFDFYRDVPGLKDVVAEFQSRGLRVFLDYNPWDTGTRRARHDDATELALLGAELGADGMFLDTMKEGDARLVDALLTNEPPQVLEGESRLPNARVEDHQLSWAQWFADSTAPGVQRARWFERRHMTHATRRWNRDHSAELQSAFMNGTGMLVWDAVFGVWVGWNDRDKATLRGMLRVMRALTPLLTTGEWTPLTDTSDEAIAAGVYASRFAEPGTTLWPMANRGDEDFTGQALTAVNANAQWFDLTAGRRLGHHGHAPEITVPARGVAAVLAVEGAEPAWLAALLAAAASDTGSADTAFPARTADRLQPPPISPHSAPSASRSFSPPTAALSSPTTAPSSPAVSSSVAAATPSSLPITTPSSLPITTPSSPPITTPSSPPITTPSSSPTATPSSPPTTAPSSLPTTAPSSLPTATPFSPPTAPSSPRSTTPSSPTTTAAFSPPTTPSSPRGATPSSPTTATPSSPTTTVPSSPTTTTPSSPPTTAPSSPRSTTPSSPTASSPSPLSSPQPPVPTIRVEAGSYELPMTYRRRETGSYQGAPYVEEWKPLPPRLHDPRTELLAITLTNVAVAASEVTGDEFAAFLVATGYRPVCENRWPPPAGDGPATMVGLDDARAYATWAGARLPTEFEWQVAAGAAGFRRATPLVWNWTESEHTDGVTRFLMLKGGSDHRSEGSDWYVDGGPRDPSFSLKFLMPGLGVDRSPSIGFRLAWEMP